VCVRVARGARVCLCANSNSSAHLSPPQGDNDGEKFQGTPARRSSVARTPTTRSRAGRRRVHVSCQSFWRPCWWMRPTVQAAACGHVPDKRRAPKAAPIPSIVRVWLVLVSRQPRSSVLASTGDDGKRFLLLLHYDTQLPNRTPPTTNHGLALQTSS
jgi:hypothetical protein